MISGKKWIKNIKTTLIFYFFLESIYIAEARMFFSNIVELLLLLYYTAMGILSTLKV